MKLASGTAPVAKYLAAGVALGLGTDGAASNNDLDMFEAMRQAAFLAKHVDARSDRRAGADGARPGDHRRRARAGHGAADRIARSRQARRPDHRVDGAARQTPLYDPVSHLVYVTRGDDVRTTIVNGKVLMRDRQAAHARPRGGDRRREPAARRRSEPRVAA